jgi:hypothetical protein
VNYKSSPPILIWARQDRCSSHLSGTSTYSESCLIPAVQMSQRHCGGVQKSLLRSHIFDEDCFVPVHQDAECGRDLRVSTSADLELLDHKVISLIPCSTTKGRQPIEDMPMSGFAKKIIKKGGIQTVSHDLEPLTRCDVHLFTSLRASGVDMVGIQLFSKELRQILSRPNLPGSR